jgi:hypothetical protein
MGFAIAKLTEALGRAVARDGSRPCQRGARNARPSLFLVPRPFQAPATPPSGKSSTLAREPRVGGVVALVGLVDRVVDVGDHGASVDAGRDTHDGALEFPGSVDTGFLGDAVIAKLIFSISVGDFLTNCVGERNPSVECPAAAVEEDLDVLEDLGPQLGLGGPGAAVDELFLRVREKALGDRVVEAVALLPIDWAMPAARACWPKASDTNWLP